MSVYPMETIASEGDRLTFDCTVSGDTIPQIKWTRDYEQSKVVMYPYEVFVSNLCVLQAPLLNTEYTSDGKGLRLTLINARQEHSGTYVCTASDQTNNTKRGSVSLAVWPRGRHINYTISQLRTYEGLYCIKSASTSNSLSIGFLPLQAAGWLVSLHSTSSTVST